MYVPTPFIPEDGDRTRVLNRASEMLELSRRLAGTVPIGIKLALGPLLRLMNSYYSNRIEGQHTTPRELEEAIELRYSGNIETARKQRLAVAHVGLETHLVELFGAAPYTTETLRAMHAKLFMPLDSDDLELPDGSMLHPGEYREVDVRVGNHIAPPHDEIPLLLDRLSEAYANCTGMDERLMAAACAHHRLAWIHPFEDGNGRLVRLHTNLLLEGLDITQGIWSPVRGFARDVDRYYARLAGADAERHDDQDGRGALSQRGLVEWCSYFFDVCEDQVTFMHELINIEKLLRNLRDLLLLLEANPWQVGSELSVVKPEVLEALHYIALTGPIERSRFMAMTGLSERTARRVTASLLDYGLLTSRNSRAPLEFGLPLDSLRILFPRLWPEAG